MNPQRYLVVVLALLTLGGAALGWKQHQELIELRAAALNKDERANLQKRLWDAEKRAKDLADELLAARGRGAGETGDESEPGASDTETSPGQDRRGRRGPGGNPANMVNSMMAFMDQPEVQKLMAIQQKGQLDSRYAALFKNLNLTPEQLDKFKSLLVERQTAMQDVMSAARAQGINPRDDPEAFRKMIADTQTEVDNNIKATLGEAGFAQYQNFQQTLPQRNLVSQLQQSLSYTSTPLTDTQSEQMIQILAQTAPKNNGGGNRSQVISDGMNVTVSAGPGGGGDRGAMFNIVGGGGGGSQITNEAIALAQGVLSAPQVAGLQQLQQQQQAQQQLQQAMRQAVSAQGGGRSNAGGSTAKQPAPKR